MAYRASCTKVVKYLLCSSVRDSTLTMLNSKDPNPEKNPSTVEPWKLLPSLSITSRVPASDPGHPYSFTKATEAADLDVIYAICLHSLLP